MRAPLAMLVCGCVQTSPFVCVDDGDCGLGGVCETSGYCSFADGVCESGRRYGELAGGGLAGMCVGALSLGDASLADALVGDGGGDGATTIDARPGATTWTATTALPTARSMVTAVAWDGRIYVIGGRDASDLLADVLVADILGDGSLGAWTATTPLPSPCRYMGAAQWNGVGYVIGGSSGEDASPVRLDQVLYRQL